VVGLSRAVLDRHVRAGYFEGAETAIIGSPVADLPDPPAQRSARDPITFGYIGRLSREKGVELLIDAYAATRRDSAHFVIAGRGDPEYERQLRRRSQSVAEFTGWIAPEDFYSRVDVVVVPSLWREPFGRVVVEAWRYGRPVITTTGGGPEELVQPGLTGWLTSPAVNPLRERLQALIDQPEVARQMADACRAASEQFSAGRIALAYEELYSRVLARARHGAP
jgi:glycosyltransferase involved in cell wall biosynthesis